MTNRFPELISLAEAREQRDLQRLEKVKPGLGGGDGGGGEGIEARVAKVEAHVDHIRGDVGALRTDVRDLGKKVDGHFWKLAAAIAAAFLLGLAGLFYVGKLTVDLRSEIITWFAKADATLQSIERRQSSPPTKQ